MKNLASEERIAWLVSELRAEGSVALAAAAERLEVSEMTVRRDLRALESDGRARRVRGGAVAVGPVSFGGRDRSHSDEKRRIAEKLLPLVPSTGLIAFDSSTTAHRLAMLVTGASDLTIVTNSFETLRVLQGRPGVHPVLTGGSFDSRSDSLVGPVAVSCVSDFSFAILFASAAAVDETGACSEDTIEEAELKRAMARSAARVVVGVNAAKLDRRAAAASIRTGDIDVFCTEREPGEVVTASLAGVFPRML